MTDEANLPPELRALLRHWKEEHQSGRVTLHVAEGIIKRVSAETTIVPKKREQHI